MMTISLLTSGVNKHTSAVLHSAIAQRGTELLRTHTANMILHALRTCTLSNKGIQKKKEEKEKYESE